jgi:hypothetical protein
MKRVLLLIGCAVCLNSRAQIYPDNLTRVGIGTGPSLSTNQKMALETVKKPIKTSMTVDEFIPKCTLSIIDTWGCDEAGKLIQTGDYHEQIYDQIGISPRFHKSSVRITQTIGNGKYLAQRTGPNTDGAVFALNLGRENVADDTTLNLRLKRTEALYSYVTVMGAKANVAVYDVVKDPLMPDLKMITNAFLQGQIFRVKIPTDYPCPTCNGTGLVTEKNGTFNIRIKCKACDGRKTVSIPAIHDVSLKK